MKIFSIEFLNPEYFFLFLLIPIFIYFFYRINKRNPIFWAFDDLKNVFKINSYFYYFKNILLFCIFFIFVIILANPNKENILEKENKNWIDIVFALDVSQSMNAYDLQPTRLEAAKTLILNFIDIQYTNRIWLVVFAWKPFIWIPLTFDYDILKETVKGLTSDIINQQKLSWTAIWDAILLAKNSFKIDEKREKVIILLTDWEANVWIEPRLAAISAKDSKIKIYSIWVWSDKEAYINYKSWPFEQKIAIAPLNDKSLKEISQITDSKFFRATDNKSFENIFKELESLEKSNIEVETKKTYKDLYDVFSYILSFLIFLLIFSFLINKKRRD